jgi:gliding motility-associated-like protein
MKYSLLYIALLFLSPLHLFSQDVQLKRQVSASAGSAVQVGNLMISSTIGEAVIGRSDSSQFFITQGFQQASFGTIADITYEISTKSETCPDTQDGEVILTNLAGCENGNYQVEWENGATGLSIANLNAGWYSFQIIACGRIIQDSALVSRIYESSCLLKFYTAFSPNGDNVNDFWLIDNISSEPNNRNELSIFNRWGNKINDFINYDNTSVVWDGKDERGKDVTEGTYYYQLTINDQDYSGYIELTR